MIRTSLLALTLTIGAVLPAQALQCYGASDDSGVAISFGLRIGGEYTEAERNDFDVMRLRSVGVEASGAERWNGCIKAFVRKPGGGEEMQFFEPDSLRRVQ